jgi:membrane-associated phospholipid phosphatase
MTSRFLPLLPLLAGLFAMPIVAAQESLTEWGNELFHDGQTVLTAPLQWREPQWGKAAGLMVITGTLMATTDQNVADYYARHRQPDVNDVMQGVSDVLSPPALTGYAVALWGAGQLVPNDELSRSGFRMGEAVVFSSLIAGGIKVLGGRARPYTGADANDFSGWSWHDDHQSFPSAHATAAFAAARVLSPRLTPWQRLSAYGAAGLVAYSRVYQSEHWLSDVVFGAGLGYGVGAALADDAKDNEALSEWEILPSDRGIMLAWLQTW